MQSEANGPVWGPGIVPIILRNLCPGCHRVQYTDETRQFYPPDFKPEGPDDTAEGWCNGVGCMPGEQGVSGPCGPDCDGSCHRYREGLHTSTVTCRDVKLVQRIWHPHVEGVVSDCLHIRNEVTGDDGSGTKGVWRCLDCGLGGPLGVTGPSGEEGAEHWSSPNGCHPDCPACAAEPVEELSTVVRKIPVERPSFLMGVDWAASEELRAGKQTRSGLDCLDDVLSSGQVGPKGEEGPTGPCGGPVGPCGPDCVRFVTVSALPAGQPNRNEDIISPDAIVGTPLHQTNVIQALWEKSEVSTPVDHSGIRGISIPQFVREHSLSEDKGWTKPLFDADYAGIELRVAEARSGVDWAAGERPGIHFPVVDLPEADQILLLVIRSMPQMGTVGASVGPACGGGCDGTCQKLQQAQLGANAIAALPCGVIRRFRQLYAAYTEKGDRSIAELQRDMPASTELIRQNTLSADSVQIWQAEQQRADTKQKKAAELVLMPKELTAENGAKALLSGEFYEEFEVDNPEYDPEVDDGPDDDEGYEPQPETFTEKVPVTWDTIKKIYKMCVAHFTQANPDGNQAGN